jgi:hypothetical protein
VGTGPPKNFENLLNKCKLIGKSSKFLVGAHPKIEK